MTTSATFVSSASAPNLWARLISYPARYCGSKHWSIWGVAGRTCVSLFSMAVYKQKWDSSYVLGKGYHWRVKNALTSEKLKAKLPYYTLPFMHFYKKTEWAGLQGYSFVDTLNLDFFTDIDSSLRSSLGSIINPQNGLKVTLLQKDDEIVLVFGFLGAIEHDLDASEYKKKLSSYNIKNIKGLCGANLSLYKQAAELTKRIQAHFPNKKIVSTGFCQGGAIAQYVALSCNVKAYCLNSEPLGAGAQYTLGNEKLRQADRYIRHISTKHDFVSDNIYVRPFDFFLSYIVGIRTPANFGKRRVLPRMHSTPKLNHQYIDRAVMKVLIPEYDPQEFRPLTVFEAYVRA